MAHIRNMILSPPPPQFIQIKKKREIVEQIYGVVILKLVRLSLYLRMQNTKQVFFFAWLHKTLHTYVYAVHVLRIYKISVKSKI